MPTELKPCIPILGRIPREHKFQARYETRGPKDLSEAMGNIEASSMPAVLIIHMIEKLTYKRYIGDVCVHCGQVVNAGDSK